MSTRFFLAGSYLCGVRNMASFCIENAALNKRALVMQERQLSRRIMYFAHMQLFWKCYECTKCETYPKRLPDWALPDWMNDSAVLKRELRTLRQSEEKQTHTNSIRTLSLPGLTDRFYRAWCHFRITYSRCELSRDSDRLVAIHGIAQQINQLTGDEFVAGLWKSRLLEELCWVKQIPSTGESAVKPIAQWRAPT